MTQISPNTDAAKGSPLAVRGKFPFWLKFGLLLGIIGLTAGGLWSRYSREEKTEFQEAERALAAGDLVSAYAHLQNMASTDPPSKELIEQLAGLAIRLGRLEDAESWCLRLSEVAPLESKRVRLAIAQKGMEQSNATLVERILQSVLRDFPEELAARKTLAHLYLLTLRQDELRSQIAAIDQQNSRRPDTRLLLMYSTGTLGQWLEREPRVWLERALQNDPGNNSVRAAYGQLLIQADEREAARKVMQESPGGKDRWRVSLVQIRDLLDTGKTAEVAKLLDSLDSESHADARFWVARGCVALDVDDAKTGRESFETAMRLDPFDPQCTYRLARLKLSEGQVDAANELFQRSYLLHRLNRTAKRAFGTLESSKGIKGELEETARLAEELGFVRLSYLLFTSLAGDFPEFAEARGKVAELRTKSAALQPLSEHSEVRPSVPELKRQAKVPTSEINSRENDRDWRSVFRDKVRFWDVAESVGLNFQYRRAATPVDKPLMMNVIGGGVAVVDFDGDRWPDLFFSQGTPLPIPQVRDAGIGRLFRNIRGTKFEEVTSAARITDFGFGQGCATADFDNDGFADVFVCHYGSIRLHRNNGDGTFREVTAECGLSDSQWSSSATFGDFDRDGDLDLFVVHYIDAPLPAEKCCLPISYPRTKNAIWENRGDGTFTERSLDAGILITDSATSRRDVDSPKALPANTAIPAEAYGLAVVAEDLDNDGWLDVYVANDMTPNFLFRNLGRPAANGRSPFTFAEIGIRAGVAVNGRGEVEAGMGLACADVDGDNWFDLFVTNFQNETNTFYHNLGADPKSGNLIFSDDTAKFGLYDLSPPKMGWGCQFIDTLGSGNLDLLFVNGQLKIDEPQTPSYFLNRSGRYIDLKPTAPYFQEERSARGVATLDWNRDLRPDAVVTYLRGNVSLLNNDSEAGRRIRVQVVGRVSNRDGESARVVIRSGKQRGVYRVSRGGGFLTSNDKDLSIGLGTETEARFEILWPSGLKQDCGTCRAGSCYLVVEGQPPVDGNVR